jgi:hypothetical protein
MAGPRPAGATQTEILDPRTSNTKREALPRLGLGPTHSHLKHIILQFLNRESTQRVPLHSNSLRTLELTTPHPINPQAPLNASQLYSACSPAPSLTVPVLGGNANASGWWTRFKAAFHGIAYAPRGTGDEGLEEGEGVDGWKAMCGSVAANQESGAGVYPSAVQDSGVVTSPGHEHRGIAPCVNLTSVALNMTYGVDAESWESEEEKMWLPEYRCDL